MTRLLLVPALAAATQSVATPHEGHHHMYGSFASNSPITDGKRVYASFGSQGLHV